MFPRGIKTHSYVTFLYLMHMKCCSDTKGLQSSLRAYKHKRYDLSDLSRIALRAKANRSVNIKYYGHESRLVLNLMETQYVASALPRHPRVEPPALGAICRLFRAQAD
jgi:hypothetical protein